MKATSRFTAQERKEITSEAVKQMYEAGELKPGAAATHSKPNVVLDAALALAAAGYPVFPCKRANKAPMTQHGHRDATTDAKQIKSWFGTSNPPMIGLPTGAVSGLFVVDLDDKGHKHGSDDLKRIADDREIPPGPMATTPSGGSHLFFKLPEGMRVKCRTSLGGTYENPHGGIDTRGDGGYVCVAPSIMEDGNAYEWLLPLIGTPLPEAPIWLRSLVGMHAIGDDPDAKRFNVGDAELLAPSEELAIAALQSIPNRKGRDRMVRIAHSFKGAVGGDAGYSEFMRWFLSYRSPHATEAEGERVWNSIGECEIGWDVLLGEARNAGWEGVDPDIAEQFKEAPEEKEAREREQQAAKSERGFRLLKEIKPDYARRMLVKGWLQATGHSTLYGFSGCGKTFAALHLAACIATGRPWFGNKTMQGAVLYLALEGGDGIDVRLDALRRHHEIPDDAPLAVIKRPLSLCGSGAKKSVAWIVDQIKKVEAETGQKVRLTIVDTVAMAIGGEDENKAATMGAYANAITAIGFAAGCHMMSVHHEGKDSAQGLRGSSALHAACDSVLRVQDGVISIPNNPRVGKQRDGARGGGIGFRILPVLVGMDEDGDPVMGATIIEAPVKHATDAPKLGREEERVLKFMAQAEQVPSPGRLNMPGVMVARREDVWKAYLADREMLAGDVSDADKRRLKKTVNQAFRNALDKLRDAEKADFDQEYLWLSASDHMTTREE
jgi:Bifunctional DNA primase/polymerase, N-terminal/AAA domain